MIAAVLRRNAAYLLWLGSVVVSLTLRPPLPVDETRYLTVAWEMWQRGDFLVPHLNGAPYSHKPPLMFWLIDLVWSLAGVSEVLARLVPTLFGLLSIWLAGRLAERLWPYLPKVGHWTRIALATSGAFAIFSSMVMFDALLTAITLFGLLALVEAAGGRRWWFAWACYGLALGLGLLSKGPVIAFHLLPAALLAPLWTGRPEGGWRTWYAAVTAAFLLGVWIGLAWAIPAARAGGGAFGLAIFWGQTAGRVAEAFAHQQPWYFYITALPLLLYPWGWAPSLWRTLASPATAQETPGLRLLLVAGLSAFLLFSVISSKQPHYLLPELSLFALAVGFAIARRGFRWQSDLLLPLSPAVVLLALLLLKQSLPQALNFVLPVELLDWRGLLPLLAVLPLLLWHGEGGVAPRLATGAVLLFLAVHITAAPLLAQNYDLRPVAQELSKYEKAGSIASTCNYHGEYGFLGRLRQPVIELPDTARTAWLAAHPGSILIACPKEAPLDRSKLLKLKRYRSRWIAIYGSKGSRETSG